MQLLFFGTGVGRLIESCEASWGVSVLLTCAQGDVTKGTDSLVTHTTYRRGTAAALESLQAKKRM